jgi:hypothetical protein
VSALSRSGIVGFGPFEAAALVGASDPLTLTPLLPGERVHACARCRLGYHGESFDFLRAQNAGQCVGCRQADRLLVLVLPGTAPPSVAPPSRPAPPAPADVVTLARIRDHVGQVVTFEGYVHKVHRSKLGTYFVKFEQTDKPFAGFKLVIFDRYVPHWEFAMVDPMDYQGEVARVRGLVQDHPTWDLEIIVHRPEMIAILDPAKPQQRIIWKDDPGA